MIVIPPNSSTEQFLSPSSSSFFIIYSPFPPLSFQPSSLPLLIVNRQRQRRLPTSFQFNTPCLATLYPYTRPPISSCSFYKPWHHGSEKCGGVPTHPPSPTTSNPTRFLHPQNTARTAGPSTKHRTKNRTGEN